MQIEYLKYGINRQFQKHIINLAINTFSLLYLTRNNLCL